MGAYFLDTSALAKRYIQEAGTAWVRAMTDPALGHELFIANITAVEVMSAIARRIRGGSLSALDAATAVADFRYDLSIQYHVIEVSEDLIASAMVLTQVHALRAYDAVQLAAAVSLRDFRSGVGLPPLTLVSSDAELNAAAVAEGLMVDDPNQHP